MPGTYHDADGSSVTAPSAAHSTTCPTSSLHDPQPLPALVFAITPVTDVVPSRTHATSAPLLTPLQLHTCASSASSATPTATSGVPRSNMSDTRSSGSRGVLDGVRYAVLGIGDRSYDEFCGYAK